MSSFRRRLMMAQGEVLKQKLPYCIYTTTTPNQNVQIIFRSELTNTITFEDGTTYVGVTGALYHVFQQIGDHKVYIDLKQQLTSVSNLFSSCGDLTEVSDNFFSNNYLITDFNYCFYNCRNLISSSPIDNDGTPIYNRSNGKEGYAKVLYSTGCFFACYKMKDYDSIPSNWKN